MSVIMSDKNIRILLIEDNPADARLLKEVITANYQPSGSNFSCKIDDAPSLTEGLEKIGTGEYDAILLDLGLPESSGQDTLDRCVDLFAQFPVIIMTGNDDSALAEKSIKMGAQNYLVKGDYDTGQIRQTIRYSIERFRFIRDMQENQERIEHLNLVLKAIRDVNQVIVEEKDKRVLIKKVCRILIESRSYHNVWISLAPNGDGQRIFHSYGRDGSGDVCQPVIADIEALPCHKAAVESLKPVAILSHENECENCLLSGESVENGAIACAIRHGNELFGVMTVSLPVKYLNDKEEHGLIDEVANDIALALHDITQKDEKLEVEKSLETSRFHFRSLMENAPDFVVYRLGIGEEEFVPEVIMVSPSIVEILGIPKSEINDFSQWLRYLHPKDAARVIEANQAGFAPPYKFDESFRINHPEKGVRWLNVKSNGMLDENGRLQYANGIITDISGLKSAEEALRLSEARYARALKGTNDGIWEWDIPANQVFFSERWKSMLGYQDHEIANDFKTWENLVHPDDIERAFDVIDEHHRGSDEYYQLEHRLRHKDGSYRWILAKAYTERNQQGKPVLMTGSHTDVTDRKLFEEALIESEMKYRSLIEQSNDMIYLLHNDRFVLYNQKLANTLGVDEKELDSPDFDFKQFVAPYSIPLIEERERNREQGLPVPYTYEFTLLTKSGEELDVEASISEVNYQDETAIQGIIRDISERKELESQLRQAQKMEAIGRLAGGVAHDFNNLLTVISGNTELALMALSDIDPLREDLIQIRNATARASNLTGQLLAFSRKQRVAPQVLNLDSVIKDMRKMLDRLVREDIELQYDDDDGIKNIFADRGQLEQVVANLVVNARDALPQGGMIKVAAKVVTYTKDVLISGNTCKAGDYAVLGVSDNGTGISEDNLNRIFEPFFTTKREGEGTGLGLSTVFGIVTQNNGYIKVDSEVGVGTSFNILLPITDEENLVFSDKQVNKMESLKGSETIMVIEDEEAVREMTKRILERLGYTVITERSGPDAIATCDKLAAPPDLIITDVVMPKMRGPEVIEKIKSEYWPEIKTLYMSGYTDEEAVLNLVFSDNTPYIQKPFEPAELAKVVKNIIQND